MEREESNRRAKANQKNASLSTGPKSEHGKAVVRWNALKHGIFSREILIRKGDGKENKAEYDRLAESFWKDLQPEGEFEEVLVDRIVACCWRLKRVLRYETAVLRRQLDTAEMDEHNQTVGRLESAILMNRYGGAKKKLIKTSVGIDFLMRILAEAREGLMASRAIDDKVHQKLVEYFGNDEGSIVAAYSRYLIEDMRPDDQENDTPDIKEDTEESKEAREKLLGAISEEEERLESHLESVLKIEQLKSESHIASLYLPPKESADQIMRYETTLERQLYHAIASLRESQRRRQTNI
jgi:hypothetical protein